MSSIFEGCSSLNELNLSNFNTNKVKDMSWMFGNCSSLKELNITNFIINDYTNVSYMFFKIPIETKWKIKHEHKNIKNKAF